MKQPWKYQKCKKLCFETRGRVLIILLSSLTPKVLNECLKFVILWALAVYVFTTENIFFHLWWGSSGLQGKQRGHVLFWPAWLRQTYPVYSQPSIWNRS